VRGRSKVPILIIIDEVHMFYDTESSREALGALDTICRTGRSQEIGILFSFPEPIRHPLRAFKRDKHKDPLQDNVV